MPIKAVYKKAAEGPIASYDYTDIAEGTGVVAFYAFFTKEGGVVHHRLSMNGPYSDEVSYKNSTDTPAVFSFDLTPFNLPQRVRGTALVSVGLGHNQGACHVTCQVYKNTISISSAFESRTIASGVSPQMVLVAVPLTTTHFKKGDFLRLSITLTNVGWGAGDIAEMGFDPKGRDGTYISGTNATTTLRFYCPFQLDL